MPKPLTDIVKPIRQGTDFWVTFSGKRIILFCKSLAAAANIEMGMRFSVTDISDETRNRLRLTQAGQNVADSDVLVVARGDSYRVSSTRLFKRLKMKSGCSSDAKVFQGKTGVEIEFDYYKEEK